MMRHTALWLSRHPEVDGAGTGGGMAKGRPLSCCCLLLLTRLGAGSKREALLQYPVCVCCCLAASSRQS